MSVKEKRLIRTRQAAQNFKSCSGLFSRGFFTPLSKPWVRKPLCPALEGGRGARVGGAQGGVPSGVLTAEEACEGAEGPGNMAGPGPASSVGLRGLRTRCPPSGKKKRAKRGRRMT